MRTLSAAELNRTLLQRQFLLERTRLPVMWVVGRLVALQAQYAPSPYVALRPRIEGFSKQALTDALVRGSVVKAGVMRGTLHGLDGLRTFQDESGSILGTMLATFTADGLIAGWWRAEKVMGRWAILPEPFEPLRLRVRREVDAEASQLAAFYNS